MSKKYQDPPIVEALCEFQFEPTEPWNPTIPGLIYALLQSDFPKARTMQAFELNAATSDVGLAQQFRANERAVFLTDDEKSLVQVGQHLLVTNQLSPYRTWQSFQPLIRQAFEAYRNVMHPTRLRRIGLRYINRVAFDPGTVPLDEYFTFHPFIGNALSGDMLRFAQSGEFAREDGRDMIRIQLASVERGEPAVILDLDYWLAKADQFDLAQTFDWVETAHEQIEAVFEACITNRLRQRFERVGVPIQQ